MCCALLRKESECHRRPCMADQSKKEKGKGLVMDEEEKTPSLEERLEGLKLQGKEE